jgi:predicted nuclease of predicted toxin-antitoxin system
MKILLDESIPGKLKKDFGSGHEVWTVKEKGWLGLKNGVLLKLMLEDGFEIFITVDQNLQYQQNIKELPILIIVLCASDNRRESLSKLIPQVLERIEQSDGEDKERVIEVS